jgi:sulfatase modifying factor 1
MKKGPALSMAGEGWTTVRRLHSIQEVLMCTHKRTWSIAMCAVAAGILAATLQEAEAGDPNSGANNSITTGQTTEAEVRGEAADLWESLLTDSHAVVRRDAVLALGKTKSPRAVGLLTGVVLKDSDASVREQAAKTLGAIGDPCAVRPLIEVVLKDNYTNVRQAAAQTLGSMADRRALEPLIGTLIAVLKDGNIAVPKDGNSRRWKNARSSFKSLFQQADGGSHREDASANARPAQLADLPDWGGAEAIFASDAQEEAALLLGWLRDRRAVEPLIAVLGNDNPRVRSATAFALGQIKDTDAVEPLIAALKDGDHDVRWRAARALGEIKDPHALGPLKDARGDKDNDSLTRQAAAWSIGQIESAVKSAGDTTSPPVAERSIASENATTNQAVVSEKATGPRPVPADLVAVAGAAYAPLAGLATGSQEAQERQRQAAQELGLPLEVRTQKTQMVFRLIPPGTFTMGSPSDQVRRDSHEGPQHRVTLTRAFYCGKFEVTQGQWQQVMGADWPSFGNDGDDAPVVLVRWDDCQAFVKRLCQMEGVPEGTYRLLTEAEWEYACRAGTETAFCYGNDLNSTMANFNGGYPYGGGRRGVYRETTVAVGSFRPNAWGLYDMHGNVWEWCEDWYGMYPSRSVTDPFGPASSSEVYRIRRGGGWYDSASECRSAYRFMDPPGPYGSHNLDIGLRLARTIAAQESTGQSRMALPLGLPLGERANTSALIAARPPSIIFASAQTLTHWADQSSCPIPAEPTQPGHWRHDAQRKGE